MMLLLFDCLITGLIFPSYFHSYPFQQGKYFIQNSSIEEISRLKENIKGFFNTGLQGPRLQLQEFDISFHPGAYPHEP